MKITLVEQQKKNPKRFNIYIDGQFSFGADMDTVVKFRLVLGKEISDFDLNEILMESEVGKLMGRMYGLFNVRLRSEKEIRQKLLNYNYQLSKKNEDPYSDKVIEKLIENLKQKGLINDLEFAKTWVESRRRSKNKGVNAIKSELFQKGIDREIVEEVLSGKEQEGQSEKELAGKALEKKLKSWRNLPIDEFKKKSLEFLIRKGFEYNVAKNVVDSFLEKEYNNS